MRVDLIHLITLATDEAVDFGVRHIDKVTRVSTLTVSAIFARGGSRKVREGGGVYGLRQPAGHLLCHFLIELQDVFLLYIVQLGNALENVRGKLVKSKGQRAQRALLGLLWVAIWKIEAGKGLEQIEEIIIHVLTPIIHRRATITSIAKIIIVIIVDTRGAQRVAFLRSLALIFILVVAVVIIDAIAGHARGQTPIQMYFRCSIEWNKGCGERKG